MAQAEKQVPLVRCMHACLNPSHSPPQQLVSSNVPKLRRTSRGSGEHWPSQRAKQTAIGQEQHERSEPELWSMRATSMPSVDGEGRPGASHSTLECGDEVARR